MKYFFKRIFSSPKKNFFLIFIFIISISILFYIFNTKSKFEILFKNKNNVFLKELNYQDKSYSKITEENFSVNLFNKVLPTLFKNISSEGENIKINPEIFKEENINKISQELVKEWESKVMEDFEKDYKKAISRLKLVSSTKENAVEFIKKLDIFYKKFSDFLKKEPDYIVYNLEKLDLYFDEFTKIEVPEIEKENYFYTLKRLIVLKNILKYYYSGSEDPIKILLSIGLIQMMDNKKIDEIFNQF